MAPRLGDPGKLEVRSLNSHRECLQEIKLPQVSIVKAEDGSYWQRFGHEKIDSPCSLVVWSGRGVYTELGQPMVGGAKASGRGGRGLVV